MKFYPAIVCCLLCSLFFSCSKDKDNNTTQPKQQLSTNATSTFEFYFYNDLFYGTQYYTSNYIQYYTDHCVIGDFSGSGGNMHIFIFLDSDDLDHLYHIVGGFQIIYNNRNYRFSIDGGQKVIIDHMDTQTIEGHFNSITSNFGKSYLSKGKFKLYL